MRLNNNAVPILQLVKNNKSSKHDKLIIVQLLFTHTFTDVNAYRIKAWFIYNAFFDG